MRWEKYLHEKEDRKRRKLIKTSDKGPWFDAFISNRRSNRVRTHSARRQSSSVIAMANRLKRKVFEHMKKDIETIGAIAFLASLWLSGFVAANGSWVLSLLIPVAVISLAAIAYSLIDGDNLND